MKNFYQKFTSFFQLSSFLSSKEENVFLNSFQPFQKNISLAKTSQDFLSNNLTLNDLKPTKTKALGLKQLQQDLEKKVYLVVTKSSKKKSKGNVLLLLTSQDRLNAESLITDLDHKNYNFNKTSITKPFYRPWKLKTKDSSSLPKRSREKRSLTKSLGNRSRRLGQSYYYKNKEGGYKSLGPVFFDLESSHQFLHSMISKQQHFHNVLPIDSAKKSLENVVSSKIISLSLKDFLKFFSSNSYNKNFEKVEFLFFPNMEQRSFSTFSNVFPQNLVFFKERKTESFKTYQQKYYISQVPSLNNLSLELENKV